MQRNGLDSVLRQATTSRRMRLTAIRLLGRQAHYAKAVFCGEDGEVSPEGERLLALLAAEAKLHRHGFVSDAERRLFDLGAQHMVRLLTDWIGIDSARLARVQQQLNDEAK